MKFKQKTFINFWINNFKLDDSVAQQSKDPGSNPDIVESVSFSTEGFQILLI